MPDELPEVNTPASTGNAGRNILGRLQGLFGARSTPGVSGVTGGGLGALQVMVGGKAKVIVPASIILVLLFGAIFFVISAVAVYASRLGALAGYGGSACQSTCQGAFDLSKKSQYENKSAAWPADQDTSSKQVLWTLSDEGKSYAINTLGIPTDQIRHYDDAEVENMIRAEVASQFATINPRGSTQVQAQRALLTYQYHEDTRFDLLDDGVKYPQFKDYPSYTFGKPSDLSADQGHATNILSLTDDKFAGFGKNKRVAASYDIHYAIYLGVQEHMTKFAGTACESLDGENRWRCTLEKVSAPAAMWNSLGNQGWEKYKNETAYACVPTGSTLTTEGSNIGSPVLLDGTTDFLHENITTTTFGNGDPNSTRPHHCADSGDNCETAYGMFTGTDPPTPYYAALPARFSGCNSKMDKCPRIEVINPTNNKSMVLLVIEIGPWNTNDKSYVFGQSRPQAESGTDTSGRTTNKAGLDIGPEAMKALGGGSGSKFNWRYTTKLVNGYAATSAADPCLTDGANATINGKTIVIDPGHNSNYNSFKYAIDGINNEGDHNWLIATKLKNILDSQGFKVLLTKNSANENPSLSERANFANKNKANFYISIHSNDSGGPGAMGLIWCSSATPPSYDPDVKAVSTIGQQSRSASRHITAKIQAVFKFSDTPYFGCGNLGTLRGLKMPGMVVEMFAHDERSDLEKVKGHNDLMAQVIAGGISEVMKK